MSTREFALLFSWLLCRMAENCPVMKSKWREKERVKAGDPVYESMSGKCSKEWSNFSKLEQFVSIFEDSQDVEWLPASPSPAHPHGH